MREDQADQMIELLHGVLDSLGALRDSFDVFTAYGAMGMVEHSAVLTGNGMGNLGEVTTGLVAVETAVVNSEATILLTS